MPDKLRLQDRGEHGDAVFVTLARPHDDLASSGVHVLDAQAAALEEAEPGSVHQRRHEPGDAREAVQDETHLFAR